MINILFIFTTLLINFTLAKRLKYIGIKYSPYPSLSDVFISFIMANLFYILFQFNLTPLIFSLIILLNILLFIDLSIFQVYSINLDYNAIKLFFLNYKTFLSEGSDESFINYILYRRYYLFLLFPTLIFVAIFEHISYENTIILAYFLYVIAVLAKIRLKLIPVIILTILLLILSLYFSHLNITLTKRFQLLPLLIIVTFYPLQLFFKRYSHTFFQSKCKVLDFLNIGKISFQKPKTLYSQHDKIVALNYHIPSTSPITFNNANVILITIESFNKEIFEQLNFSLNREKKIHSKHHFAVSSNTYETLFTLYNGTYKEKKIFSYLEELQQHNYNSIFFSPQNITYEDTDKLLKESGFKNLIFNKDNTQAAWGNSDAQFYKKNYEKLSEQLKLSNYFLHILNSQTHAPYNSFSKKFKTNSIQAKEKYKASLQESLYELNLLLKRLEEDGFLKNTIIILTGDHGESFGELNYNTHSSAMTKEQLELPFIIIHEDLKDDIDINFSTHLDIFPTIFDLLGINSNVESLGNSIFNKDNDDGFITYSRITVNGLPSSFGYINAKEKIFIDLMYNRFWITDLNDKIVKVLNKKEKKKILWTLFQSLRVRKIIG